MRRGDCSPTVVTLDRPDDSCAGFGSSLFRIIDDSFVIRRLRLHVSGCSDRELRLRTSPTEATWCLREAGYPRGSLRSHVTGSMPRSFA